MRYLAALLLTGCISGTASINDVCDTKSITFPVVSNTMVNNELLNTQSFMLPTGSASDWISELMLISGNLSTNEPSFDFVDELTLSVKDPNSNQDVPLWTVQSPMTNVTILDIEANDVNLVQYIRNKQLTLDVFVGVNPSRAPNSDWTLDVDLCVSAMIKKNIVL